MSEIEDVEMDTSNGDADSEDIETASVRTTPVNTARLIFGAIALEAGTKLVTNAIDRMVLARPSRADTSLPPMPGPVRKFTAARLAKIATKSKPGAIVVAGGLLAKHIFDRGGKRMKAKRKGRR